MHPCLDLTLFAYHVAVVNRQVMSVKCPETGNFTQIRPPCVDGKGLHHFCTGALVLNNRTRRHKQNAKTKLCYNDVWKAPRARGELVDAAGDQTNRRNLDSKVELRPQQKRLLIVRAFYHALWYFVLDTICRTGNNEIIFGYLCKAARSLARSTRTK